MEKKRGKTHHAEIVGKRELQSAKRVKGRCPLRRCRGRGAPCWVWAKPSLPSAPSHVKDVRTALPTHSETAAEPVPDKLGKACSVWQPLTHFCMQHTDASGFHLHTARTVFHVFDAEKTLCYAWALPRPSRGSSPLHSREGLRPVHPFRALLFPFPCNLRVSGPFPLPFPFTYVKIL